MHTVVLKGWILEEFEAMQKDAARYRWLRDKWFLPGSALPWCGPPAYTEELDTAIDDARRKD